MNTFLWNIKVNYIMIYTFWKIFPERSQKVGTDQTLWEPSDTFLQTLCDSLDVSGRYENTGHTWLSVYGHVLGFPPFPHFLSQLNKSMCHNRKLNCVSYLKTILSFFPPWSKIVVVFFLNAPLYPQGLQYTCCKYPHLGNI